jgi:hypothetical protein
VRIERGGLQLGEDERTVAAQIEAESIVPVDKIEKCFEQVIAVISLADNMQKKVQFGWRRYVSKIIH